MKKTTTLLLILWSAFFFAKAQDSVKYRLILIGDAGEMNTSQKAAIQAASARVMANKTTVLFLGDNVYPFGMSLPGTSGEKNDRLILQSQFAPLRAAGAAVYFLPGNHDWDKSGPDGLAKIRAQGNFLASFNDPLLKLVPANGCPDPVEIKLTDQLTVIAYDSEWYLFPYAKQDADSECECRTKEDMLAAIRLIYSQNEGKQIIMASHHPFQSYGSHGGYFTLRDHIFPLTRLNRNIFIPLPVIGSIYPFLRTTFESPEDLGHPDYKRLIRSVRSIFGKYPNVTFAAGHEHGLQLIKSDYLQIVSGAGAKSSVNHKKGASLFNEYKQGYVVADQLKNNDMRYTFYVYTDSADEQVYSYLKPFVKIKTKGVDTIKPIMADSIVIRIKPSYDSVGKFHRWAFGENYRKEYALPTKVPVIRISEFMGGLVPIKQAGGNQTLSLRLQDKKGNEWVLRSVEKYPEVLLPPSLRETFARDIIKDNMSAQHPFSALVVPDLAEAAGVPHSNPVIGWVSPDENLAEFGFKFANTLCLLERREPAGETDNTAKMYRKLTEDNDNTFDAATLLRSKALDVLIGDWDRHDDQVRWKEEKKDGNSHYIPVPRDRDQVFFKSDGLIQRITQTSTLLPMMQGYERNIRDINWLLWEGREINSRLLAELDEAEWNRIINDLVPKFTDELFEKALRKLPEPGYSLQHDQLLSQLKIRRAQLPKLMNDYYHFFNRIVDIELSDKNEFVKVTDTANGKMSVRILKISKKDKLEQELYARVFDPEVTREIRIYTHNGNDSLIVDAKKSDIKLRIIGGYGKKTYTVDGARNTVKLYENDHDNVINGAEVNKVSAKISLDTANVYYVAKDMYKRSAIGLNLGFNSDDGILVGLSYKITNPGFRKIPYGNAQAVSFLHSFKSGAFRFNYNGEWIKALGSGDFLIQATAYAPDNTQNFFGVGNETYNYEDTNGIKYYRARFNLYQLDPMIRYRRLKSVTTFGPSFQYYRYDADDNAGRFINNPSQLHSSDSLFVEKDKMYAGAAITFSNDTRDNRILPTLGTNVGFKMVYYQGLNKYSGAFTQVSGYVALYKNLDGRANIIIADRFGGGFTIGQHSFYQSLFLGGEGTLLGYRQFRFAGEHSFYNNLEARFKLGELVSYILPGQAGLMGFYDVGRVWADKELSDRWHHGVGAGLYFAPASLTVLRFIMGYSKEGWYPYFSMNLRF